MRPRSTKYTHAVLNYLHDAGHATNAQILQHLHTTYPDLSATTVHRITARLTNRGELSLAPPATDSATRFDSNTQPHDHFQCLCCDRLRDVSLPPAFVHRLQELLQDCTISGHLNVQGVCHECQLKEESV